MSQDTIRLLLIDDEEDDYIVTSHLLSGIDGVDLTVDWRDSFESGLVALRSGGYDVCLLDYRLGARTGIDLLRASGAEKWRTPVIMLTGSGDEGVDVAAMAEGATDYVRKDERSGTLLRRTIRYAIERKRAGDQRRVMEDQLARAKRFESLGALAGGVAHEVNNILTVILADTGFIANSLPADRADLLENIEGVQDAARRGAVLTKKLLSYSRRERLEFEVVDLADIVEVASHSIRRLLAEHVQIKVLPARTATLVRADAEAIKQIIVNLATNARDAMPDGGTLEFSLECVELTEAFCTAHTGARAGAQACLRVRDTGCGMDQTTLESVFEPFFTTKDPGAGTGLGMAMVFGLVKQHGGYIEIESAVGVGTTVTIYFPLVTDQEPTPNPVSVGAELRGGSETILLVEDQESLRRAGERILRDYGYTVYTAGDGEQGLIQVGRHVGEVDLIITDVVMPHMGGMELYEVVRTQSRPPKVLFMSGYSARDLRKGALLDPQYPLLPKPWTMQDLLRRVREILDAPAVQIHQEQAKSLPNPR